MASEIAMTTDEREYVHDVVASLSTMECAMDPRMEVATERTLSTVNPIHRQVLQMMIGAEQQEAPESFRIRIAQEFGVSIATAKAFHNHSRTAFRQAIPGIAAGTYPYDNPGNGRLPKTPMMLLALAGLPLPGDARLTDLTASAENLIISSGLDDKQTSFLLTSFGYGEHFDIAKLDRHARKKLWKASTTAILAANSPEASKPRPGKTPFEPTVSFMDALQIADERDLDVTPPAESMQNLGRVAFRNLIVVLSGRRPTELPCQTKPDIFHVESERSNVGAKKVETAKALCSECPRKAACLQDALDNDLLDGIYGGMTPDERRVLQGPAKMPA